MSNGYINIAHLYKRVPVLTDTNGDHLDSGFEIVKTYDWVRFNEPTKGVLVRIKL